MIYGHRSSHVGRLPAMRNWQAMDNRTRDQQPQLKRSINTTSKFLLGCMIPDISQSPYFTSLKSPEDPSSEDTQRRRAYSCPPQLHSPVEPSPPLSFSPPEALGRPEIEGLNKRKAKTGNNPAIPKLRSFYLHLKSQYSNMLCWSNNPGELKLATYFDPEGVSNLACIYGIKGLRPVLREDEGDMSARWILIDDLERWYIWQEDDMLLWIKSKKLKDMKGSNEKKVDYILRKLQCLCRKPVFSDYHPDQEGSDTPDSDSSGYSDDNYYDWSDSDCSESSDNEEGEDKQPQKMVGDVTATA